MKQSLSLSCCNIKIIPLFVFVCVLALLLRLGFWQLSRAEEKRELLANQFQKMEKEILPMTEILLAEDIKKEALRYQRVSLQGRYDVKHQFLIDNQIHDGKVGCFVLTPFRLTASHQTVLINRGWVLMDKDRTQLPDVDFTPLPGEVSVVGVINTFPEVGWVLKGADEPGKGWPSVVQLINNKKIRNKLNQPILDFQVQLAPGQAYGYIREWKINMRMPPEKHVAYAFQWFSLAFTLTLLTLWGSCKKHKND